ncbi:MAG: radical SAM/SPASM domain-containing protein [Blastocatellia bacterium]
MEPDHFRFDLPFEDAVRLVRTHVELIEVETTSYCNRTCSFCPNSFIDRRSTQSTMPESAWEAILGGLRLVEYDGTFVWSRYSEPLSERRVIDRVRQVREHAPSCRIAINSNGDYLDAAYMRDLEEAGLNRLFIDLYIPDAEVYDLEVAYEYHNRFLERIDRTSTLIATIPELTHRIDSKEMEVVSHVRNIAAMKAMDLSDRGGLITIARKTTRVSPCYLPYKHLVIDWDGSIVICCQVRSDSPEHASAVVGKIGTDGVGLVDAYARLAGWRRALRSYGPKYGPCESCNLGEYDSTPFTREVSVVLTNGGSVAQVLKTVLRPVIRKRVRY